MSALTSSSLHRESDISPSCILKDGQWNEQKLIDLYPDISTILQDRSYNSILLFDLITQKLVPYMDCAEVKYRVQCCLERIPEVSLNFARALNNSSTNKEFGKYLSDIRDKELVVQVCSIAILKIIGLASSHSETDHFSDIFCLIQKNLESKKLSQAYSQLNQLLKYRSDIDPKRLLSFIIDVLIPNSDKISQMCLNRCNDLTPLRGQRDILVTRNTAAIIRKDKKIDQVSIDTKEILQILLPVITEFLRTYLQQEKNL
ncbi:hypothetical protein MK079_01490 [Candidatus Gracilibacteria bacterium]|nr:hypothetical protein [Candidatus Gracilibacteria bacterium]